MKELLLSLICTSILATVAVAQTRDSFDIASFQPPAGWAKQAKDEAVLFSSSDKQKGSFAMLVVYRSDRSSGDPKGDFDADWKQFVEDVLEVKAKPEMEPRKSADGWTITIGATTFESADLGKAAVILSTYSGYGRKFSATAIFNSADYGPAIEAFAASIVLDKSAPTSPAPVATTQVESPIVGTWGQNLGAHITYGDPVSASMAGYSKDQYTFNANGTYTFVSKTFRMAYDKIILVIENGTYQINGDALSIRPQKSVIQAWSKLNGGDGWGRLLTTQPRKLEAVTYKFTKHYFSGIGEWNLVLQADQPTERDGPFSTFKLFPNAWYYKPLSSNNPVIVLPR
jgi:hypothetical protein